jgi:squalene synthase HpnC
MSSKISQTVTGLLRSRDDMTVKAARENFPVASRLLPRGIRSQLMAIYAFARLTDDIGDEAEGDRLALLDWLDDELTLAGEGRAIHPVFQRLTPLIEEGVSLQPFRDLIEANRVDQRVTRYSTFDDLVAYCMLSAAPVGRLVLAIFNASSAQQIERSDQVCIALQVVEHLQDVGEDARRGRIYLPLDDMQRFGCSEEELLTPGTSRACRELIAMESNRVRALLAEGSPLAATLAIPARIAVAGFVAGGLAALDSIERAHYDVLSTPCRPSKLGIAQHMARTFGAATLQRRAA